MTGQDAKHRQTFNDPAHFDGVVLTKLDGDFCAAARLKSGP
jgi:signal recognition particle GTPase